jgi:hypothetical protein
MSLIATMEIRKCLQIWRKSMDYVQANVQPVPLLWQMLSKWDLRKYYMPITFRALKLIIIKQTISITDHSPTNTLFIKLGRFKFYNRIHINFASAFVGEWSVLDFRMHGATVKDLSIFKPMPERRRQN